MSTDKELLSRAIQLALVGVLGFGATQVAVACPRGGTPAQENLGRLLLKANYSGISCKYLGTPYSFSNLQAHAGIDYPAAGGSTVYAPMSGTLYLSGTDLGNLGGAVYYNLGGGKKFFIHHLKIDRNKWTSGVGIKINKGDAIPGVAVIRDAAHVHAELRVDNPGTQLIGGASCGKTCTYSQIDQKTDDPSSVIVAESVSIKDFWRKADPLYAGEKNGFDAQFKLVNSSGKTVNLESVYLALHDANNNFIKDMKGFSNVSIGSGQTWQTGIVYTDTPLSAGTYRVVAKIDENFNGKWDGRTIGEETFTLKAPQPILSSLKTSCPSTVNENSNNVGVCSTVAYYSNGTSKAVTPSWADNSNALSVSTSGNIATTSVTANTNVIVTGTYKEGNVTKQATANILVKDIPTKVTSVSPLTVDYGQRTTFTVKGTGLTDNLAFWIDNCQSVALLSGGTSTSRSFTCTPSFNKYGVQKGVVSDKANGTVLYNMNVTVNPPKVISVSPLIVTYGQKTTFTVKGTGLTDNLAFWVDSCVGASTSLVPDVNGTSTTRTFTCTPSYSPAVRAGVVRDKTGGTTLYSFKVTVAPPM